MFTQRCGVIEMATTNLTEARSGASLPGFELGASPVHVTFCVLQNFAASSTPGGISLWPCSGFAVTALFRNFSIASRQPRDAIVCRLDWSLQTSPFSACSGVGTATWRGRLFVSEANKEIVLLDCCFAALRDRCLQSRPGG